MTQHLKDILILIGLIIGVIAYIPYITHILQKKNKPHLFTWILWAGMPLVIFAAQLSRDGGNGSYITLQASFLGLAILMLSVFYGDRSITRSDWISFIAGILTIPLWYFTKTPLYSLILVIVIDAFGFYPTLRKTWYRPYEETLFTYVICGIKYVIAVIALTEYNLMTVLYPVIWASLNIGFILYSLWRRAAIRNDH